MTFKELNLKSDILKAIEELGFESPMPVQAQTIPFVLEKESDLVALAQTGTGKTAAFGLPILNLIDSSVRKTQALILSPTRELCIQIAKDLGNFSKYTDGIRIVAVYGGEDIRVQLKKLDSAPQIIVATPGRLIDLVERRKVDLSQINFLVLDEADEMLNMGFKDDLETILQETPSQRRTFLFSATMPAEISRISKQYMKEYEEITVGSRNAGSENVSHIYYLSHARQRYLVLKRIVDMNPSIYGIIFCRTRQETKEVADKLMHDGYNADALHGDLSQAQRDTVMQKFRIRNLQLLVATDVAARGLDVSDLTHVINYNLPDDVEIYTHRSGRTGRANKKGVSVSIIHMKEKFKIRDIERMLKKNFEQHEIPNGLDVCKKQLFHLIDKMQNVEINEDQILPYMAQVHNQLEYMDKEEILKRFVSLEFNRFLEYYQNAEDLNVHATGKSERGPRVEGKFSDRENSGSWNDDDSRGRGGKSGRSNDGKGRRGNTVRLKIGMGSRDNINPNKLLGVINDVVGDKTISVMGMEITNKYTFFDVYSDQVDKIVNSFANQKEIELGVAHESKGFSENNSSGSSSRGKFGDKKKSGYGSSGRSGDGRRSGDSRGSADSRGPRGNGGSASGGRGGSYGQNDKKSRPASASSDRSGRKTGGSSFTSENWESMFQEDKPWRKKRK